MNRSILKCLPLFIAVVALSTLPGCSSKGNCTSLGTKLLENRERLTAFIAESGLPLSDREAARLVGASWAMAQVEYGQRGGPVLFCLRQVDDGTTEFRVFTPSSEPLSDWQATARY